MTKDEIQVWTLLAFFIVTLLSSYKLYLIFSVPSSGLDTKTQYAQLEKIIINYLKDVDQTELDSKELFSLLQGLDDIHDDRYKNFNHNRLNQLLQGLFYRYDVYSLPELISKVKDER